MATKISGWRTKFLELVASWRPEIKLKIKPWPKSFLKFVSRQLSVTDIFQIMLPSVQV
jgi:hypothetical protein